MKYAVLFAALLAVGIAGCGKKEETAPYSVPSQSGTKPQPSDASKGEPLKTDAATSAQAPAVAAAPAPESKSAEGAKPATKENK